MHFKRSAEAAALAEQEGGEPVASTSNAKARAKPRKSAVPTSLKKRKNAKVGKLAKLTEIPLELLHQVRWLGPCPFGMGNLSFRIRLTLSFSEFRFYRIARPGRFSN